MGKRANRGTCSLNTHMKYKIINKLELFGIMFVGYTLSYNGSTLLDKFSDFISLSNYFPVLLLLFWIFISLLFINIGETL
jgi:hypothetical protein